MATKILVIFKIALSLELTEVSRSGGIGRSDGFFAQAKLGVVRVSSRRQLKAQKLDLAPAYRRECRQDVPQTASWRLLHREQGTYVSR